jgi:hypothetical protein
MSKLSAIKSGKLDTGYRFCLYGDEGVGKTTAAAAAPKPIIFDVEDGSANLDIARYPFTEGAGGHVPATYEQIMAGIDDLIRSDHDFRTLIIDSLDRLESLIWKYLLARDSKRRFTMNKSGKELHSIEDYGYGKGYILALDQWRSFCRVLDLLRQGKRMNIILIGHQHIRTFKNPEGDDFDRYHIQVHDKAAGFLKGWCDVVGFCCYEGGGAKLDADDPRAKGYSTGARLMKLERTAAYDAKSRIPLPAEVKLDLADPWGPLGAALAAAKGATPAKLQKAIAAELARLADPALTKAVKADCAKHMKNPAVLSRFLNNLKSRQPKEEAHV